MTDLLFHFFGPSVAPSTSSQNDPQKPQGAIYSLRGALDGLGPSHAALEALSAAGVAGTVHLRTVEDDVIYSLDGNGTVQDAEEPFLS